MQCVPLCTMCHTSNPGNNATWQKKMLPLALDSQSKMVGGVPTKIVKAGDAASLKEAYKQYAATADKAILDKIQKGQQPQTGEDVCGPTYGCAVRVEKEAAAPRDFTGPLWIVGAVMAGGILRRRRRKPSAS